MPRAKISVPKHQLNSDEIYSSTTKRYALALILVAGLSFMAYLTMHRVISEQEHLALVVNMSGRQRMYSQRIALLSELLKSNRNQEVDGLESERAKTIDDFEKTHEELARGSAQLGKPIPEVLEIYFGPMNLDHEVHEYIATARALNAADLSEGELHDQQIKLRELALTQLLPKLDKVVELNQRHSEAQIQNLHHVEISILIFTLLLLALEATLIFRPMAQHIVTLLSQAYEAESAAIEASYEKSNFLATVTHEIRSPLTAVVGMTESLLESPLKPEQRESLAILQRVTDGLIAMINDLLDYSKIESGKLTLEEVPFDFDTLLVDTERLFQSSAHRKGVKLVLESNLFMRQTSLGDPTRIRQVITNFVSNAIKFTNAGGTVIVRARETALPFDASQPAHSRFRIEVEDSGVGISEAAQAHLFQRYSQADESVTRKFGGTGLGLSICKQIVEIMHGRIGVQSREGSGSTFWFEVDLHTAPSVSTKSAVGQAAPLNCRGKRALIAEDNQVNLRVLTSQLIKFGFEVRGVSNGKEAVDAFEKDRYDLVILDCEMPVLGGLDAAKRIREEESQRGLKRAAMLVLTGHDASEIRMTSTQVGVDEVATKPLKTLALSDLVSKLVN